MINNHAWIKGLDKKVEIFLENMSLGEGKFKYSFTGDLIPANEHWNLGGSVFALKILYMIKSTNIDLINSTVNYIESFKNGKYYFDPVIAKKRYIRNILSSIKHLNLSSISSKQYKKADTRQSISSLLLFNRTENISEVPFFKSNDDIVKFLKTLNWKKPWDAGSHFSHLMFFLYSAKEVGLINDDEYIDLSDSAISFINSIQDDKTGSWHSGSVSTQDAVNGAMKILTGLAYRPDVQIKHTDKLLNTCLSIIEGRHGCDKLNLIFTLNRCLQYNDNLQLDESITSFLDKTLSNFKEHYHQEQHGFSFFKNKANDWYYSAKITSGINEPDIHGTVLFLWGISLIDEILEGQLESGLRPFRT